MTVCVVLFVSAVTVVRLWSEPLAVVMCVAASALPPVAVIVANRGEPGEQRWRER